MFSGGAESAQGSPQQPHRPEKGAGGGGHWSLPAGVLAPGKTCWGRGCACRQPGSTSGMEKQKPRAGAGPSSPPSPSSPPASAKTRPRLAAGPEAEQTPRCEGPRLAPRLRLRPRRLRGAGSGAGDGWGSVPPAPSHPSPCAPGTADPLPGTGSRCSAVRAEPLTSFRRKRGPRRRSRRVLWGPRSRGASQSALTWAPERVPVVTCRGAWCPQLRGRGQLPRRRHRERHRRRHRERTAPRTGGFESSGAAGGSCPGADPAWLLPRGEVAEPASSHCPTGTPRATPGTPGWVHPWSLGISA